MFNLEVFSKLIRGRSPYFYYFTRVTCIQQTKYPKYEDISFHFHNSLIAITKN